MISLYASQLRVSLKTGIDMINITDNIDSLVTESKIQNGTAALTVIGSTGSITTIEYEPGVISDLKRAINKMAPPGEPYEHEKAWHDGNGHSHVQAAIIGPSISIPVRNGGISLGTWQQLVVINHDNRPRERTIKLSIIGDG